MHVTWEIVANPILWIGTGRTLAHNFVELVGADGSTFLAQFGFNGWELYQFGSHEEVLKEGQGPHGEPWLMRTQELDLLMGQVVDSCFEWPDEYGLFNNCQDFAQYLFSKCEALSALSKEQPEMPTLQSQPESCTSPRPFESLQRRFKFPQPLEPAQEL